MLSVLHRSVCFKAIPYGIFYLQPVWKTINKVGSIFLADIIY